MGVGALTTPCLPLCNRSTNDHSLSSSPGTEFSVIDSPASPHPPNDQPANGALSLISAEGVAKRFNGVPALKDGRLSLRAGSVHALCGGNGAGKSTFLNILMGILRRDAGTIRVRGADVDFASPAEALAAGISMITQELSPLPGMTVAENIFLGREPRRAGFVVDFNRLYRDAGELLQQLQFDIDPRTPMHRLSLAQTQLVEIAKAFSHRSEVVIMDEPTSAIGERETEILFAAIRRIAARGAGIVYVSHRLSEIFSIADSYTVFRDGGFVETGRIADIDRRHLVRQIVGREVHIAGRSAPRAPRPALLSVQALGRSGEFDNISLDVAPGEVLGIYGLMGSGRSEWLNCVYGITRPDAGEVRLRGEIVPAGKPGVSIRKGISLVTEDRKDTGLVLTSSVAMNISLSALPTLARAGVIERGKERGLVQELVQRMRVKLATPEMAVAGLSGGNQQKVVLARCMATNPVCLLCDEPTRGIDEGAKREVYALIDAFTEKGGAVVLVSSEAPEVLEVSDRIAVFKKGRVAAVVDARSATQEELLHLAS